MYIQKLMPVAGLLAAHAAADFIILENLPTPTALPSGGLDQYLSSVANVLTSKLPAVVTSLGTDFLSRGFEANDELESFVKTATISIPSGVVGDEVLTFTTTPPWFTALPSKVQKFNEEQQSLVKSIYAEAAGVSITPAATSGPTPSGAQGSNAPNGTAGGANPEETGAAGVVAGMGAGYLAVFAAAAFL